MTSAEKTAGGELLSLLDNLDVIAWEADAATLRMRFVSAGAERILGHSRAAWTRDDGFFADHVHADDRALTLASCNAVAGDGTPRRAAFRMLAADGRPRFMEMSVRRAAGPSGEARLLALMVDLSLRKSASDVLASGAAGTRLVMEQLPLIVWTTDRDLRFSSGGGAGLARLGLEANQLTGVPVAAYLQDTGAGENPSLEATAHALQGGTSQFDVTWGGRAYHAHIEPFRDSSGAIIGSLGIAADITERKELEAERDRLLVEASFLADASRILGHSLEHLRTIAAAATRSASVAAEHI